MAMHAQLQLARADPLDATGARSGPCASCQRPTTNTRGEPRRMSRTLFAKCGKSAGICSRRCSGGTAALNPFKHSG